MCAVAYLCLTLCNPMDCSLPGSPLWNFPGKNIEVGYHFLLQCIFLIQGLNLCLFASPALSGGFFTTGLIGKMLIMVKESTVYCRAKQAQMTQTPEQFQRSVFNEYKG